MFEGVHVHVDIRDSLDNRNTSTVEHFMESCVCWNHLWIVKIIVKSVHLNPHLHVSKENWSIKPWPCLWYGKYAAKGFPAFALMPLYPCQTAHVERRDAHHTATDLTS